MRAHIESNYLPMPDAEWEMLSKHIETVNVSKDYDIKKAGSECKYVWFIVKGAVKGYELTEDARIISTHFFVEEMFFVDLQSVLTRKPSEKGYIAVEDCILERVSYQQLLTLYDKSPVFERLGRLLGESQMLKEFELRKLHLNYNALDRYSQLIETMPYIFQRFALKDIASFIGVTPESLSRIRKNMNGSY